MSIPFQVNKHFRHQQFAARVRAEREAEQRRAAEQAGAAAFRPHPLVAAPPVPHAIKGHSRYYAAWGDTTG